MQGPLSPSVSLAVDGSATDGQTALAAEEAWLDARRAIRKKARVAAEPIVTPSCDGIPSRADETEATGAQRQYGTEREEDLAELSEAGGDVSPGDKEPANFGKYVHAILATVDLSGANLEPVARTLARQHGVTDANAARAITMVDRVLRLPLMNEARAATKIFREVPLAGGTVAGRAQGNADLVFERDGEWRVVDFKTDHLDVPEALRQYAEQLAKYSTSLALVVGAQVKAALCLVRKGEIAELP